MGFATLLAASVAAYYTKKTFEEDRVATIAIQRCRCPVPKEDRLITAYLRDSGEGFRETKPLGFDDGFISLDFELRNVGRSSLINCIIQAAVHGKDQNLGWSNIDVGSIVKEEVVHLRLSVNEALSGTYVSWKEEGSHGRMETVMVYPPPQASLVPKRYPFKRSKSAPKPASPRPQRAPQSRQPRSGDSGISGTR